MQPAEHAAEKAAEGFNAGEVIIGHVANSSIDHPLIHLPKILGIDFSVTKHVFMIWLVAAVLFAISLAMSMFMLGAAWSTCLDIGGNHAGVVSAAMNTSGQVGSIFSPLMVTSLLARTGDWNVPLFVMGALFLVGAAAWCFIDPHRRIFD